jgi:hypothetical protein
LPDSLVEAGDVSIAEGDGARLLSALTEGTLLLDPYRKGNRSRRFAEASEVADACPAFYTISYPRRFDLLPTVRRAIVERVARDGVSGRTWMAS